MSSRRAFLHSSALAVAATALDWRSLFAHTARVGDPDPLTLVRGTVGVFTGRGGTIGWHIDPSSVVVVDTQFPDTAKTCLDAVNGRTQSRAIDYLVNTHHHGDHTAGNGVFRASAKKIVAQANVPRLQREAAERAVAAGGSAQPQVVADTTFDLTWRQDVGGEVLSLKYYGPAHTGGDAVVMFERANVVHMGDLVFNRRQPVIDPPGGSSVAGWVTVLEGVMKDHAADTIFIFGHAGANFPITGSRADLQVQRDFLVALLDFVRTEMKNGTPRETLVKYAEPLKGFPDHGPLTERVLGAVWGEVGKSNNQ